MDPPPCRRLAHLSHVVRQSTHFDDPVEPSVRALAWRRHTITHEVSPGRHVSHCADASGPYFAAPLPRQTARICTLRRICGTSEHRVKAGQRRRVSAGACANPPFAHVLAVVTNCVVSLTRRLEHNEPVATAGTRSDSTHRGCELTVGLSACAHLRSCPNHAHARANPTRVTHFWLWHKMMRETAQPFKNARMSSSEAP